MYKIIIFCLCCTCITLFAIYGNSKIQLDSDLSVDRLRDALLLRQHKQRKLQRLKNSVDEPLMRVLGESTMDLQIRLAESLLQKQEKAQSALVYEQVTLPETFSLDQSNTTLISGMEGVDILRLDVQGQVSDGRAFLRFFDEVDEAIQGWPTEMRACKIQKIAEVRLEYHCVLDTYHWTIGGAG